MSLPTLALIFNAALALAAFCLLFLTLHNAWVAAQHRRNLDLILSRRPKLPVDDTYRGFLRHLLGKSK